MLLFPGQTLTCCRGPPEIYKHLDYGRSADPERSEQASYFDDSGSGWLSSEDIEWKNSGLMNCVSVISSYSPSNRTSGTASVKTAAVVGTNDRYEH